MATARVLRLPQTQPRRDEGRRSRHLRLIPGGAGLRLTPRAGVVLTVLAFVGLFAVAVCHALLIERQAAVDELEAEVAEQQARYEELSLEVAELSSPERIRTEAMERLGMVPAEDTVWLMPDEPTPTTDDDDDEADEEELTPGTSAARVKPYIEASP